MSLVSTYPTSAYPTSSPSSVDIGNTSMPSAASPNSPYYGQAPHQTLVTIGDYSTTPQHQSFYASSNWSWPNATNGIPSDYQHHVHQQPSPPLSCYSSSAPSPDYYNFNSHQQASQQTYDGPIEDHQSSIAPQRVVRVVKRRNTANKKERRRTMSINNAFSDLRDCIPNVPADTKLSKIKTLRLATSYISYLMAVLETGSDSDIPFRAELGRQTKSEKLAAQQQQLQMQQMQQQQQVNHQQQPINQQQYSVQHSCINKEQAREETNPNGTALCPPGGDKRSKGRTGWPHHVWALELKQ